MRSIVPLLIGISSFAAPLRAEPGDPTLELTIELEPSAEDPERGEIVLEACQRAWAAGHCRLAEAAAPPSELPRAHVHQLDADRVELFLINRDGSERHETLGFLPSDSPAERGKAIGLALGALASPEVPAVAPAAALEPVAVLPAAPDAEPETAAPPAATNPSWRRYVLGAQLGVLSDPGLAQVEWGGALRFRGAFFPLPLWLRAGFDAYGLPGSSPRPGTTRLQPTLGLGGELRGGALGLELGLDAGAEWLRAADGGESAARWTPLLRAQLGLLWDLSTSWGTVFSTQGSWVSSPTDVFVDGVRVASSSGFSWGLSWGLYRRFGE